VNSLSDSEFSSDGRFGVTRITAHLRYKNVV
jgi:hypothetical protein